MATTTIAKKKTPTKRPAARAKAARKRSTPKTRTNRQVTTVAPRSDEPLRLAVIATVYRYLSHAQHFVEEIDGVQALLEEAEAVLKPGGGRVLLRYSGTEPKIRLLLEGPEQSVLEQWKEKIMETLRRQIGA